jgi:hypothetical protein
MSLPKPKRGTALLERRQRRAELVKHEQTEMQAALKDDNRECRRPTCQYRSKSLKMPVDACHVKHRGMGGNPSGSRTDRATVISLCRMCHGEYDAGLFDFEPLTGDGTRGPCAFYDISESGERLHVATEVRRGESEMRSA